MVFEVIAALLGLMMVERYIVAQGWPVSRARNPLKPTSIYHMALDCSEKPSPNVLGLFCMTLLVQAFGGGTRHLFKEEAVRRQVAKFS